MKDMHREQNVWNARYAKVLYGSHARKVDQWLEPWLHLAPAGNRPRALDIGCGCGHNAKLLSDRGFQVTAVDISDVALELCRREVPKALVQRVDLRKGLAFPADSFELIVADLSLHYFPWNTTVALVGDVANSLTDDGLFAGRFNSTSDTNYGANTGEPVDGEPNLFIVGGIEKRFFTRECFRGLFGRSWIVLALEEKTAERFGPRKTLWELIATHHGGNLAEPDGSTVRV